jgi:hypothetical protein
MLAYLFIAIAVVIRFLPHSFHFTPVGAALLYFGAKQPAKRLWIPLALFAASDVALNIYVYHFAVSLETFASIFWYLAYAGIGMLLKNRESVLRVAGASLAGSAAFFVVSNFIVWLGAIMYPMTVAGLAACFTAAIPFFRGTLEGDALFTALAFGVPAIVKMVSEQMSAPNPTAAA